jgi:hypothetical protein
VRIKDCGEIKPPKVEEEAPAKASQVVASSTEAPPKTGSSKEETKEPALVKATMETASV